MESEIKFDLASQASFVIKLTEHALFRDTHQEFRNFDHQITLPFVYEGAHTLRLERTWQ